MNRRAFLPTTTQIFLKELVKRIIPSVKKNFLKGLPEQSHKYSHGTVAVWAGSEEYPGAAVLSVGGARRGGSGYVNFIYDSESVKNLILFNYQENCD